MVGEEGRLPVAGIGGDEDGAVVSLGSQPVEQPVSLQCLVAKGRPLDLGALDGERAHVRCLRQRVRGRLRDDPGAHRHDPAHAKFRHVAVARFVKGHALDGALSHSSGT